MLSTCDCLQIFSIRQNNGFEQSNSASGFTLLPTDSATTCETSRFSIPETIASRNTYQVNRGLVVTLPSEAQTYSHLPAGYSDRWLTLSVSPFLTFTPSSLTHPEMTLPKSILNVPSSRRSKLTGLRVSSTLSVGPMLAVSLPCGTSFRTAWLNEESSNPGLFHPGISKLAS